MFKFTFDEKEYILNDENFDDLINDDEKPVKDIDNHKDRKEFKSIQKSILCNQ